MFLAVLRPSDCRWSVLFDTGDRISARTARRLACKAGIIPVVLGGKRKVLDVGRRQRLFTRAQRIALLVRDGGCTAAGCQTAAWFCHAHHDDPWSHGGPTDLANGRLLCPSHHRMAHDPRYDPPDPQRQPGPLHPPDARRPGEPNYPLMPS